MTSDPGRLLSDRITSDSTYFEGAEEVLLARGEQHRWVVPQEDLRAGWDLAERALRSEQETADERWAAFVSLPFDRRQPAIVHIPEELTWWSKDRWVSRPPPPQPTKPRVGTTPAAPRKAEAIPSPAEWCQLVDETTDRIATSEVEKVVLSRRVLVEGEENFSPGNILRLLRQQLPGSYFYSFRGLVGASPELLVGRRGPEVFSLPLAGTIARHPDPHADRRSRERLYASRKLNHEHDLPRSEVIERLGAACTEVTVDAAPQIISTAAVHHLGSRIRGTADADTPPLMQLAAELHPTSAVCGWPRSAAYELLEALPDQYRDNYCGAFGWVDAAGDGVFVVAIRCIELDGNCATVHVGNGIVGDSDPEEELAETCAKLRGLLDAVLPPEAAKRFLGQPTISL